MVIGDDKLLRKTGLKQQKTTKNEKECEEK